MQKPIKVVGIGPASMQNTGGRMKAALQSAANAMQGLTTYRPLREELLMATCQTTKFCTKCKTEKAIEMFSKHSRYKDGRQSHCKACHAKYQESNREKILEQRRAYREANKEKIRKWHHENYANNRDKILTQQREYYEANKDKVKASNERWKAENLEKVAAIKRGWAKNNYEKVRASSKRWRANNPGKAADMSRRWRAANPEKARVIVLNRVARRRACGGKLSQGIVKRLFKLQCGKCACCGLPLGNDYHLDHIMPLALGGTNTDDNIQLLRAECNLRKSAKHPVDFMRQKGFLL